MRIDLEALKRQLQGSITSWLPHYLPGHIMGGQYRAGNLNGEEGSSLSIALTGSKAGSFYDFAEPEIRGDILELIKKLIDAQDFKQVLKECEKICKGYLPEMKTILRIEEKTKAKKIYVMDCIKNARQAYDTIVQYYLNERDLDIRIIPDDLRYLPKVYCNFSKQRWESMCALVRDANGNITGHQLTFLDDNTGYKADIPVPRICTGSIKGNSVHLNDNLHPETLYICEGIEDGIAIQELFKCLDVWAVLGAANLSSIVLPLSVKKLIVCLDNDDASFTQVNKIKKAYRNVELKIIAPKPEYKDFNDELMLFHKVS